jgi:hypothetical protein
MTPGHKTEVTLLSDRFFALTTHWLQMKSLPKGATVPCPGEDCGLCEYVAPRGLFFLAVAVNGDPYILEMAAQSSAYLEQHVRLLHGGLVPGHVLELQRMSSKSPIRSEYVRHRDNVKCVPMITLCARVMALFRFPGPNPDEGLEQYETRIRLMAQRRCTQYALEWKATPNKRP